jgi:hypothetical protein
MPLQVVHELRFLAKECTKKNAFVTYRNLKDVCALNLQLHPYKREMLVVLQYLINSFQIFRRKTEA